MFTYLLTLSGGNCTLSVSLHQQHQFFRGERGKGVWRCRYTVTTRMTSELTEMGSGESHFNVSVESDGQSHRTVSTNHNLFEDKGEPKRYRTEVLPLICLTPYR